jgi:uncharacterized protein
MSTKRTRPEISLVVLQPTSLCNLNCRYCYVPGRTNAAVMDDRTLDVAIAKVLRSPLTTPSVEFLWHAGEPLTVGVDFYRRACELVKIHNQKQLRVRQTIQTNATLIDRDWCRFLSDEKFGVGVSVDGPEFLHDKQRSNWAGRGSHTKVMRGVELLGRHGIRFGALCVVTSDTLDYPDEFYRFFSDGGFRWLGFQVEEIDGVHGASSLMSQNRTADVQTVERYSKFIERLFDLWKQDTNRFVIREFQNMLQLFTDKMKDPNARQQPDETKPIKIITIRRNGEISTNSPEFASSRDARFNDFKFGNINDIEIEDVLRNQYYRDLQRAIRTSVQRCAESCMYYDICGGRYLSNKHAEHGCVEATETVACKLHRQIVASVILNKLARTADQPSKPPSTYYPK